MDGWSHPGTPGNDVCPAGVSAILEHHDPWPLQATDLQVGFRAVGGDNLLGL